LFCLLAQTLLNSDDERFHKRGVSGMKELGNNFAKLAAIIMFMITLAISTAALSQWANPDTSADGSRIEQGDTNAPALAASATH
jgi:hypothetical protein